jgi:alpha-galactosidase
VVVNERATSLTSVAVDVTACGVEFTFAVELAEPDELDLQCTVEPVMGVPESVLVRFRARSIRGKPFSASALEIRWTVAAVDMHGVYMASPSLMDLVSLPFWEVKRQSAANLGMPFAALFHRNSENRFSFGLIDQLTETDLSCTLSEATRSYHFHWRKPRIATPAPATQWDETLFVSCARRPWPQLLASYRQAVEAEWPQPKLPVPDHAYDPVFCTWTAIHHDVSQEWILRNAKIAADLGFRTWLTDDGWFTEKARFADYRYTGDWHPAITKFPDFKGHVAALQAMGLRYILWVGPFMVGDESEAARGYAHLLMDHNERLHYCQLSPWYRETGTVIAALLQRLVNEYGLDGLKIDFIDAIQRKEERPTNADYASLGEGIYEILCYAIEQLATAHDGLLIELRNRYTNLAGRRYGNLYRASDVPLNFAWNRWQATMLRLLAPDRAVHLDPALWHPDDNEENVAVHLINIICSVPIVSVELDRYPQSHLQLIRYWIGFYQTHRQAIIHGRFEPTIRLGHIPLLRFSGDQERIIGVYDDFAFALEEGPLPLWLLNASTRPYLEFVPGTLRGTYEVTQRDKFGNILGKMELQFPIHRLEVEIGGSLEVQTCY